MRSLGPKVVLLKMAKSKFLTPSCRSVGSTRDSLPKPHCGGAVKHAVLNHSFRRDTPAGVSRLNEWFNTACFTAPPQWGFGSESRVDPTLRQDGVKNFDFAIFKRTTFGPSERMNVEFRTEFFNLFNHPQFAAPNTTRVSPNFGVVTSTLGNPRLVQFGLKFAF